MTRRSLSGMFDLDRLAGAPLLRSPAGRHARILLPIVAATAFDATLAGPLGLRVAAPVTLALLHRRPALRRSGLATAFVTALAFAAVSDPGSLDAPLFAGLEVALTALALAVVGFLQPPGHRVRGAGALIQILAVGALAAPFLGAVLASLVLPASATAPAALVRLADWPSGTLGAAAILPILLVARRPGSAPTGLPLDPAVFVFSAGVVGIVSWTAERWFPYPFVVACVPLFVVTARLPPTAVAVLGAGCMIEMVANAAGGFAAVREGVSIGALVLAAALTGVLPTGLALLLEELRGERERIGDTEERLRRVLAGIAGHGFCSLDRHGRVVGWNDKIAAVTGFVADEVTGRPFDALFLPEDREAGIPEMLIERAAETGRVERLGWRLKADGTRFWARTTIEASHDARGTVVGFVKSVQDESELQRSQSALLAAERRIGFALGSAGQGVWDYDVAARRMSYSDIWAAMLGLPIEALGDDPAAWKARVHPDDVEKIPPDAAGEEAGETELRIRHADGRWIWISDRRRVAERDDDGRPTRVIGIQSDVTARKLAEEKFRLAVEASPSGLLIADADGRITLVNREFERMFGYETGDLLGRSIDDLVPEAHPGAHAAHRAAFAERPSARRMGAGRDLNGRRRDGTLFPVEIGLNPIATTEGTQILCVVTDITARKLAEEKFRLAVEASPNGVLIADREGRITLVNSEVERMFGHAPGTLLGRSIDILVPEDHRAGHALRRAAFAARPAARRMGAGRDLNGRRSDGTLFPVEIGLNPIMTAEGESILCVVTDITARKQTEAELAVSEARYRMMADNFIDLVVHLDLDLNRTWVSPASLDILGVPPEALLGGSPSGVAHPDDMPMIGEALRAVVAGADRGGYCARYRHADGQWIWLSVALRLIRGPDAAPLGILAVARDVTRALAAEEALKASEATFRGAMEGASMGMALEELDGRWVSVNRALCDMLGLDEADLVDLGPSAFALAEDADVDAEPRRRLIAGEIGSYQVEKRWRRAGGSVIWTQQSVSLDRAPDGSPRRFILQIQDVTERRQIEQMKSEFVSMVSHELRTPLTSIRGALGLVLGTMTRDLPARAVQLVDIAHKNSERLIPLVNDILDLDKIDAGMLRVDLVEADAGQLVRQSIEATRAFADRYGVALDLAAPDAPVRLRLDEGRFIQVVTNLLSNAAKFSPRGSTVEVAIGIADGRARVSVRDHGPGIPEEFRPRIFGRFAQADQATTRAKGGSGLGLHISRQLVGLMGGRIDFESTVGAGSTFWVDFPLVAAATPSASTEAEPTHRPRIVALAADTAFADFLATAAATADLEATIAVTPEPIDAAAIDGAFAVFLDRAAASTATEETIRAKLEALGADRPRIVLVDVDASDRAAVPIPAIVDEVWTVDPGLPATFVRRLAALSARLPETEVGLPRVLHVEDDLDLAAVIAAGLAGRASVVGVSRAARALQILETQRFDLAIVDPDLPDGDGLAVLSPLLDRLGIPILVLSAEETVDRDEVALARLVKSRISEPQLVETIVSLLDRRRPAETKEGRHVG